MKNKIYLFRHAQTFFNKAHRFTGWKDSKLTPFGIQQAKKIAKLLKEYSKKAQIVMISHNDSIIAAADYLYGVSMNKGGESKLVSLEL